MKSTHLLIRLCPPLETLHESRLRSMNQTTLAQLLCALAFITTSTGSFAQASQEQQMLQARELATSGQREAALAIYEQLLADSPNNGDILLARGRTLAWMNRWEASEQDLQKVTTDHPTYGDAWSALGDMYFWSDRPAKAADAYAKWAELNPNDPAPYIAQGRALRDSGNYGAAAAAFRKAQEHGAEKSNVDGLMASLQPPSTNPTDRIPEEFRWVASGTYDHTGFESSGRRPWNDYSFSLRRRFDQGSLAFEVLKANRFGSNDSAYALDGYVNLWSRAYANVRYQWASADSVFPQYAARAEIFQGVGSGWELSASYDRLKFSDNVDIYGLGVGKYFGNYYARIRTTYVPGDNGTSSRGYRILLRNYYRGDADSYIEVRAGHGRGNDYLPGQGLSQVSSGSAGVSWVYFPERTWGFKVSADYGRDSVAPNQYSMSFSIYRRW